METGYLIYFSSLAVLAFFFLGGTILAYLSKNVPARGFRIIVFNLLFVITVICIGASGAYMAINGQGMGINTPPVIEQLKRS